MQTYQHIIRRLNESQKIRLLTNFDSLADPEMTNLGLPRLTRASIETGNHGVFPSPAVMARSWDPALCTEVSARLATIVAEQGTRCLTLPGPKAAIGTVADSLSEDPLLSGAISGAYLRGACSVGLKTFMGGYGFRRRKADAMWSERKPSARVRRQHLIGPFKAALSEGPCGGVVVDPEHFLPPELTEGDSEYPGLRTLYFREEGDERPGLLVIRHHLGDLETVFAIERGDICLDGSAIAVQSALHTHRRLQSAINHGKATTGELNAAIAAGEAISEETLDEALERLIAFATACKEAEIKPVELPGPQSDTLPDRALRATTVLLENRVHTLPLHPLDRLCLIGHPLELAESPTEMESYFLEQGYECLGYAKGYDLYQSRSDKLIDEAETLALSADVVVLFLSAEKREGTVRTVLPANQLALYDRLGRMKKQLVVVISTETPLDMSFLSHAFTPPEAVLLAPLHVAGGVRHTLETLLGQREPEGRLACTLFDADDAAFNRSGLKEGPLLGYRYYDAVGSGARYPFGHGLSFAKFRYSNLTVNAADATVTFKVKNIGKETGVVVPQVYVGMEQSAILRPVKELAGFARIELLPEAEATVTIALDHIGYYNDATGHMAVEKGMYTISVGNSVADIRLRSEALLGDESFSTDGGSVIDHLPSVSNIQKDHFTLEAEFTPMKSSLRNPLFGVAALVLAACVKIFDILTRTNAIFLDILAAVLAVGAIVFLALELVDRKKLVAREQKRLEEINSILYADATKIEAPTADALFANAYDPAAMEEEKLVEEVISAKTDSGEYDYFADVDQTLTFADAARDFARLAVEKGVEMEEATARAILSSMATSRLVVVKDMDSLQFSKLMTVLCEYLACPLYLDKVDATYTNESAVLFRPGATENAERPTLEAITTAQNHIRNIHVAALTDVTWAGLSTYFVPYANYARAPLSASHVTVQDPSGRNVAYHIPENLWFFLNLKAKETLANIPDYVAEIATVNSWSVASTKPATGSCTEFRQFYYGQLLFLADRVKSSFVLDEDIWKKIDRMESFANRHTEFHIGNKQWLGLETYLAVLASTGMDVLQALDEAMAVKLMPALIHALSGKLARDERGLGESLDVIFGDNTARCRKTIKDSGADII